MTADNMRPVTLKLRSRGALISVDAVGLIVACAPGLLVTPWYVEAGPVRGRFGLTHAASGSLLVDVPMCAHDVRRWAVAAGWIGVDWQAPAFTVCASGPARVFAFRLCDEWRAHCDACSPVEPIDSRTARLLARSTQQRVA